MNLGPDRDGFLGDVYRRFWSDLCRYVHGTFGSGPPDPEDVAQTAFTKFAALDAPHAVRNPKAFLITTARNIVLDHHKVAKSRNGHLKQIAEDGKTIHADLDDLTPERVLLGKEELGVLRQVLERLPKKRRELLLLQRVHGLSYVDLSKRTGLSQTTVKYHVAMAFAECLSAMGDAATDAGNED
ncbi:MAG: sigma-70 family RNA polymerase sigma factor [Sphingomonadales bacterium]|nr:sigma-70 family RNA polymerase sigma factor [Sphingomonadales bacterium]